MNLTDLIKIGISCVYGLAGSGRSCFCLTAAIDVLKKREKVVYVDTENSFSVERFKQIAGSEHEKLLDNLFIFKIKSFRGQQQAIKNIKELMKKINISLVVVDSISYFYRRLVNREPDLAKAMLRSQLRLLNQFKVPVIITSEVFTDIETKRIKAVGHEILRDNCSMIYLRKRPREMITQTREKYGFEIVEEGLRFL